MKYTNTRHAKFIARPNRFIAYVALDGKTEMVHVKNTSRCRELLLPGADVILSESPAPARKTKYDLVAVYKENFGLVNIDSQAPNQVVKEWLRGYTYDLFRPEYTREGSRVDFYFEKGNRKFLVEVKGCTLEIGGVGYFPDAPTQRGTRHLHELAKAAAEGYACYVAFVIQMAGVETVLPNSATDPAFAKAYEVAVAAGVRILHLPCKVTEDGIRIAAHGSPAETFDL